MPAALAVPSRCHCLRASVVLLSTLILCHVYMALSTHLPCLHGIILIELVKQMLVEIFKNYSVIGFSGSRTPAGLLPPAVLSSAAAAVPAGARVVVGCQRGVDAFFRQCFPKAEVFAVASGRWGSGKGAYAGRSIACVQSVAGNRGLWVAFAASECPPGLLPSAKSQKCFSGFGSGTWASLAYALGCGVSCLVFSPCGIPAGWGLAPVPNCLGWFQSSRATQQQHNSFHCFNSTSLS
jgi:hypothetical protein